MSTCQHCGATIPEGTVYCGNCEATINSQSTSVSASKPLMTSKASSAWPNSSSNGELPERLEKAMKRAELLGYAAAGLGIAILVVLLVISLL